MHFVDKNKIAHNLINQNLKTLNATENTSTYCCDFLSALENFNKNNIKFDLVLLDPPFRKQLGKQAIQNILKLNLLNEKAVIMLECANDEETTYFEELDITEVKKYGTVKVIYYIK